jgi:4-diphosphocytidyl-2C-methyl-D-erythritol kinase
MMRLEGHAPAKLNLTLEVLGRRADGYHEVASVMHTLSLCDPLTLELPSPESFDPARGAFHITTARPCARRFRPIRAIWCGRRWRGFARC